MRTIISQSNFNRARRTQSSPKFLLMLRIFCVSIFNVEGDISAPQDSASDVDTVEIEILSKSSNKLFISLNFNID